MYYDAPTAAELAEDEKPKCPDCGSKLKSVSGSSEYWGSVRGEKELYCDDCGYEVEV